MLVLSVAALLGLGGVATVASSSQESGPSQLARQPSPAASAMQVPQLETLPRGDHGHAPDPSPTTVPLAPTPAPEATPPGAARLPTATSPTTVATPPVAPTPFPEVGRADWARFAPSALVVPRLGIDARIVPVGITAEGHLEAPADDRTVGWYHYGPAPGEVGRAVLDGHLDSRDGPAVFYRLREVAPGDEIIVRSGGSGGELTFVVRQTASFPTAEAPLDLVFGLSDRLELVLITCDGPFDRGGGSYLERLIVVAELRDNPDS